MTGDDRPTEPEILTDEHPAYEHRRTRQTSGDFLTDLTNFRRESTDA